MDEILKLKEKHAYMGPAQIRAQLKRFKHWRISVGAIASVLRKNGYQVEHRSAKQEMALQRFEAPRPNYMWQMDALQFRVHELKLYLHLAIDDFSRFIVGHRLSERITSSEAVATLTEAIAKHGKPERVLTDRGAQFMAVREETAFRRFLERELIDHSVSRPYHPQTLGKVEAVNRALQKELIYMHEFASAGEARRAIDVWVERFNFKRAHMGIDGLVPADRYFGLHKKVLAEIQARSRGRQTSAALDSGAGSPVDDIHGVMEVLRLVLVDGKIELRFCGARVELGDAHR
jgi:transposase InsO family protein